MQYVRQRRVNLLRYRSDDVEGPPTLPEFISRSLKHVTDRPLLVVAAAVVVFILFVVVAVASFGSKSAARQKSLGNVVWYLDLDTGKLMAKSATLLPPIPASSPTSGVRAYVFSCGGCDNENARFVAYVERYEPEARSKLQSAREQIASETHQDPDDVDISSMPQMQLTELGLNPYDGLESAAGERNLPPQEWTWHSAGSPEALAARQKSLKRCNRPAPCSPE